MPECFCFQLLFGKQYAHLVIQGAFLKSCRFWIRRTDFLVEFFWLSGPFGGNVIGSDGRELWRFRGQSWLEPLLEYCRKHVAESDKIGQLFQIQAWRSHLFCGLARTLKLKMVILDPVEPQVLMKTLLSVEMTMFISSVCMSVKWVSILQKISKACEKDSNINSSFFWNQRLFRSYKSDWEQYNHKRKLVKKERWRARSFHATRRNAGFLFVLLVWFAFFHRSSNCWLKANWERDSQSNHNQ